MLVCGFLELDINFEETFYSMEEGPTGRQIILQFTSNQNPFSLTLQTMDITTAESEGFTSLLDTHLINKAYSRATEGELYTSVVIILY